MGRAAALVFIAALVVQASPATPGSEPLSLSRRGPVPVWMTTEEIATGIPPLAISADRLLVTAGDTLYMLDTEKHVRWTWTAKAEIIAQPVIDSKGVIHGIAEEGVLFVVDGEGHEKWTRSMMGAASYEQILPYGKDLYVVVTSMQAYKDRWNRKRKIKDKLDVRRCGMDPDEEESVLWSAELPAGARVHVWDDRILAVHYGKKGLQIREIVPPKAKAPTRP